MMITNDTPNKANTSSSSSSSTTTNNNNKDDTNNDELTNKTFGPPRTHPLRPTTAVWAAGSQSPHRHC